MCLKPKGIQNLSNTCLANSILQALLSVKSFSKSFEGTQHCRDKSFTRRTGEMQFSFFSHIFFFIKVDKVCLWVLIDNDAQWTSCKNFRSFPRPKKSILTLNYFKAWGDLFLPRMGEIKENLTFSMGNLTRSPTPEEKKRSLYSPTFLQGNQVLKSCWQTFYFFLGAAVCRLFLHLSPQFNVYFSPKFTAKHMVAERNIGSVLFKITNSLYKK